MKAHARSAAGFSLVEITLALGVAAFCLIAVFGLVPVALNTQQASVNQTKANAIISQVINDLRADVRLPQGQQSKPQEPAGTAAAQAAQTSGGAASKPAGMAIAPAKQRQVRSFLIKLGAIAGAGVAIGTVVALSKGSPSKPPGAR